MNTPNSATASSVLLPSSPRFFADKRALVTGVRAPAHLVCDHLPGTA